MTKQEIQRLTEQLSEAGEVKADLIETHISYLILSGEFAYKIKKPVKLSFLDFSSLEKRKHFCEEEVRLNRRLTSIYLGVEPVGQEGDQFRIGLDQQIVDYAVKMKRLPSGCEMDNLLVQQKIEVEAIYTIASMIADFHRHAEVITLPFNREALEEDFADLRTVGPLLGQLVGPSVQQSIREWITLAGKALNLTSARFEERVGEGFVKDGHGDLHSGNIFILDEPVIFDCIEFSDHLRQNDVLSELAFLAMDLELHGYKSWRHLLVKTYNEYYPCFIHPLDEVIFQFFLLYRANVRLKVTALAMKGQDGNEGSEKSGTARISDLTVICKRYAGDLSLMIDSYHQAQ